MKTLTAMAWTRGTQRDSHSFRTGQTHGKKDGEETITSMRNSTVWPRGGEREREKRRGMHVQSIHQTVYVRDRGGSAGRTGSREIEKDRTAHQRKPVSPYRGG